MTKYAVTESTPGYLPESDPYYTDDYEDAIYMAGVLATDLEEAGYEVSRIWTGDRLDYIQAHRADTVVPDLGRVIEIHSIHP